MLFDKLENYFYWINERHSIYLKRQQGESWPWTEDPILQTYKFTNPFRENDRVTVWIRENIREPYADHPMLFFNLCVARMINWPETLENIGFIDRWDKGVMLDIIDIMHHMQRREEKVFTGAYILNAVKGNKGESKPYKYVTYAWDYVYKNHSILVPTFVDSLERAWNRLINGNIPYVGGFIAYEIVTDLRWTRYLNKADDILTWANAGPGAIRGINRLYGIDFNDRMAQNTALSVMNWLLSISYDYIAPYVPQMEMRDIEHSLCEWDKYQRALNNEGKLRSKYIPEHLRR